ncbi:lysophospholipase [Pyronema omphalodes]|nr:lysophospholipase [Pyronema omphalodes]
MKRANLLDFDIDGFIDTYSPNVALAFSGGGYRAMLSGAGAVKAMDIRTPGTTEPGQIGGLLQSATYMAGLSGGSWLLGSVVLNNFTTIHDLQHSQRLWNLKHNILAPEGFYNIIDTYYNRIHDEVTDKGDAGFDVSLTDYWSRALSRQFLDWKDGGPGVTWSSIALTDEFKNGEMPFPIIVADGRYPGEFIISKNTTVYEFNPFEFGSFDPTLYAFTRTEYIGTKMKNGRPIKKDVCVRGFDNAGFIMGTSSSLFNQIILQLDRSGLTGTMRDFAEGLLTGISESEDDIADYSPNPFYGVHPHLNPTAKTRTLTLVDGGEDLQNVPLQPLIQPARKVDVIFAFDNSADTTDAHGKPSSWPNGTALIATYLRARDSEIANGTLFPHIPDVNTFLALGLNNRPTFFGCNATNITAKYPGRPAPPLLVYMPNSPYTYQSNVSTMNMDYTNLERDSVIENGFYVATQGNSSRNAEWPACVACAIIHRELERRGNETTEQCKKCFEDYCWDGTLVEEKVGPYSPELFLGAGGKLQMVTGVAWMMAVGVAGWLVL